MTADWPGSVVNLASRVAAGLPQPAVVERHGVDRWAHLPGGGVGPKQPGPIRRLRVGVASILKPVVYLGLVLVAGYACWRFMPGLVPSIGFGSEPTP